MELLIEKLVQYWAYPFVRYALVVGVLVALCASLLGVTLVLKRGFPLSGTGCPMWPSGPCRWPLF